MYPISDVNNHLFKQEDKNNLKIEKSQAEDDNDGWASDSGSSSGSYYSSDSSSSIEWEICSNGDVFHIESPNDAQVLDSLPDNKNISPPPPELRRRRSTRAGKLMRLIRRKESCRRGIFKPTSSSVNENNSVTKSKGASFQNDFRGEKYSVNIWVDPDKRHKLGRRATLCEAYLGIIPQILLDKSRVLVAGFVPDGEALKSEAIQPGDWLQFVDSKEVTSQNLDGILGSIKSQSSVILKFQKNLKNDNSDNSATTNYPNQSVLVRQIVDQEESKILMDSLMKEPVSVLYLKTGEISENESDIQGVIYNFPKSKSRKNQSFLMTLKGAFITLNHMMPGIVGFKPSSTVINTSTGLVYVIYILFNQELLLISFPEKCCSQQEALELVQDILRCLNFTYENLNKCFSNEKNHFYLDHLFYIFFSKLLLNKKNINESRQCDFSFLQPAAFTIYLPQDAQIQIDTALSEMEAMDYRDWNEDPLECQRLYTILGSCLYHKKFLLGTHLPHEDLIQVNSFLRRNGLINLVNTEQVKSLVIWKRIYPASRDHVKLKWQKGQRNQDKWYLLVVGYGHDLLAVILESGGCTSILEKDTGPDVFYVEEAQETLKHIRKIGIPTLAEKWIKSNTKPETVNLEKDTNSKGSSSITENILGFIKSTENQAKPSANLTSIIKPYENLNFNLSPKTHSIESSQDSLSQGTGGASEVSDEAVPILGRRATRERAALLARLSDDSDSDLESDLSQSGILDIRENLLNQAEYMVPQVITTGDKNLLLHYVQLDLIEGVLLSSNLDGLHDPIFINNFNASAQIIQKLFNDSARNKKLLDVGKFGVHKSLIAIKEYGVLFEWENCTYWIVGRLINAPKPKELYICYQDGIPQNLTEIAFRIQSMHH